MLTKILLPVRTNTHPLPSSGVRKESQDKNKSRKRSRHLTPNECKENVASPKAAYGDGSSVLRAARKGWPQRKVPLDPVSGERHAKNHANRARHTPASFLSEQISGTAEGGVAAQEQRVHDRRTRATANPGTKTSTLITDGRGLANYAPDKTPDTVRSSNPVRTSSSRPELRARDRLQSGAGRTMRRHSF